MRERLDFLRLFSGAEAVVLGEKPALVADGDGAVKGLDRRLRRESEVRSMGRESSLSRIPAGIRLNRGTVRRVVEGGR